MRRRTLLSGLALMGVSGCLRLSPDEATTATPSEQPTATSIPDTATRTQPVAGSTPSPTQSSRYPSGLTAQGVEDNLFQLPKQALGLTSFYTTFRWIDAESGGVMQDRDYDVTADGALGTFTDEHGGRCRCSDPTTGATGVRISVIGSPTVNLATPTALNGSPGPPGSSH